MFSSVFSVSLWLIIMEEYDVVVIGGGPGGAVCARELAGSGHKVLLIERDQPGRYKPCAGGISPRTALITPMRRDVIEREIVEALLVSPRMRRYELTLGDNHGWVVYRDKYDDYLRELAADAGAEIVFQTRAERIEIGAGGASVVAETPTGEIHYKARCVVGAFGLTHGKQLMRQLGITPPKPTACVCIEMKIDGEQVDDKIGDRIEAYFDTRIIRDGYGWIYPRRAGASAGIATRNPSEVKRLKQSLMDFINHHPIAAEKLYGWQPYFGTLKDSIFGHLIPVEPAARTDGERFLLVGDAAGAADPLTGEGIYHAQATAKIAAEFLSEQLKQDKLAASDLNAYEKLWKDKIYQHGTRYTGIICEIFRRFPYQDDLAEILLELAGQDEAIRRAVLCVFTGIGSARETFRSVMTIGNLLRASRRLGWKTFPLIHAVLSSSGFFRR